MPISTDTYNSLNPAQLEAVTAPDGPLLIVAGAGSGKTRVLTLRIVHLIERGYDPNSILAVTFTNKAAGEMKSRVAQFTGAPRYIGTFHSICMQILRRESKHLGFTSDFTIYDTQDQLSVIKDCLKELNISDKVMVPKGVVERISRCKDELMTPEMMNDLSAEYGDTAFVQVYKKYQQKLQTCNALDFGDLIMRAVQLFEEQSEVLAKYQQQFRVVLVDEYQDTNGAQYALIKFLAKHHSNITVVGDPDQSIYEWRGANVENILHFEKDFSGAKVVRLEQNYRSTNRILKAANAVITNNSRRKPKNLWSDKGDGEVIQLYKAVDERMEATFVVSQILQLRQQGYSLMKMVGFYRTHAQSRVLEEELLRYNIPYKIIGGLKFYARKEIKDLLAYLRVIYNPGDEVSLLRIINVPKRSIGETTVEKIKEFAYSHRMTVFSALPNFAHQSSAKLKNALMGFFQMIESLREEARHASVSDLLQMIVDKTNYVEELRVENTLESKSRIENIREFAGSVREFEDALTGESDLTLLAQYLEFISLQTGQDSLDPTEETFNLMTFHSAKGLEFPIVFMLGMEEGLMPHGNALSAAESEMEEERRLCYVGMTRAMERLYMIYARERKIFGYQKRQIPSRFLFEIPPALMHPKMDPREFILSESSGNYSSRGSDRDDDPDDEVERQRRYAQGGR